MQKTNQKKVQWHPACFAALNLEFMDNKHELEITQEHAINELPLRVDILIRKTQVCTVTNEIGKIFRIHNLVEYKSPEDELSFDTFLKGLAEAYLYKVCTVTKPKINLEDITLTFIRERRPIKLFGILRNYNFVIEKKMQGIYYVSGRNLIPIQIVVSKYLDEENHRWLSSLTGEMDRKSVEELAIITNQLTEENDKKYADTIWEIVTRQNRRLIERMRGDENMCKALAEIFKPEIDAAVEAAVESVREVAFNNGFNNGFNDGFHNGLDDKGIQVFKNMVARGFSREDAQALAEISDELVEKALMESK